MVVVWGFGGEGDAHGGGGANTGPAAGFGWLNSEEEAEADAAARLAFLKALVQRKRLYFGILAAFERVEGEVPDGRAETKTKLASVEDLEELAERLASVEERCDAIKDCEVQAARLETMTMKIAENWGELFDEPEAAETAVKARADECRDLLTKHAAALLKSLPYRSLEEAVAACEEAHERLTVAEDGPSVLSKTAERVGSRVKSTRGLLKTGVKKLREKPITAAVSAAEYTKGVWVRLNGGMDGSKQDGDPAFDGLPYATSKAEEHSARVLRLMLEVQDCDKALAEASKARDSVMARAKGGDSLSRVRLAQEIRTSDEKVSLLRRIFAVRTLQVEMERIVTQLEEEAALNPTLDGETGCDEVEILVAEFGEMDKSLRKLVSMVDRGEPEFISDDDLTELATDIPDLKNRLGIADDGLPSMSLELIGERIARTAKETGEKITEGAEFMGRGVKMLASDIGSSARFFGRAAMGTTLRPREVQTIRQTTLDIFTFVPFVIILIIPLTPVGHVLVFSFIQRYFPAFFPSQFSTRRQEVMKKYEDLSAQLKAAETAMELKQEDEALQRAVVAVDNLIGGGQNNQLSTKAPRRNLFNLKGLERRGTSVDATDAEGTGEMTTETRDSGEGSELEELRARTRTAASMMNSMEMSEEDDAKGNSMGH